MTEKQTTMPEKAFLESLDSLETLVKGMVTDGAAEAAPPVVEEETVVVEEDLAKGGDALSKGDEDLEKCGDKKLAKGGGEDEDDDPGADLEGEDIEKGVSTDTDVKPVEPAEPTTFADELVEGSENIQKAIEVSEFLADLVDRVGEAIDNLRAVTDERFEKMEKSLSDVAKVNQSAVAAMTETLRKSYQAVAEKTDQQAQDLRKSLGDLNAELSKAPARGPKTKTHVLSKSFGERANDRAMNKEDILKSLTDMFEKGDPNVTSMDIVRFESGGSLSPHVMKALGLG